MRRKKQGARALTHAALLVGLVLLLTISGLGYIPFLTFSVTIIHLPVLLAALTGGWKSGLIVAFFFGATSWYQNLTAPASVLSPLMVNPLVSILPRMMIIPAMMLTLALMRNCPRKKLVHGVTAAVGSLSNTLFTLSAITAHLLLDASPVGLDAATVPVMIATVWSTSAANAALECAAAVILCTAVMAAYERVFK